PLAWRGRQRRRFPPRIHDRLVGLGPGRAEGGGRQDDARSGRARGRASGRADHPRRARQRHPCADEGNLLSYEAASLDTREAQLTTRARESDAEEIIASDRWEFVDSRTIRL